MAIVFQTGFDHYTVLTQRFNTVIGSGAAIGATGRNSTNGLRFTLNAEGNQSVGRTLPTAAQSFWVGAAYATSALPPSGRIRNIFEFTDVGTVQCVLALLPDGSLIVQRGSQFGATTLGTASGFSMLTNVYYYLEWYLKISPTVGETIIRVNEVERLNLTNQNTRMSANNTITVMALSTYQGINETATLDFDDVYVDDAGFKGDVQVLSIFPDGTSAIDQWSAVGAATTREAVDETVPNSDTDYAEETTAGELSLHTYQNIPATAAVIAVCALPFAKKTDAGGATIRSVTRISGNNYEGADQAPSNGTYEYYPHIWQISPATGLAWTASEVNSAEFGFKRQS
jgi:hypothetical protein